MGPLAARTEPLERFALGPDLVGYRSPLLGELGVPHAFTTRHDGGGLALSLAGDDGGQAAEARLHRLVVGEVEGSGPRRIVRVRQVHGATLREVSDERSLSADDADALATERDDCLLVARTADCVPILLARTDGRRVAAVHAGWRGLVAGVIPRALATFGGMEPVAVVGPCLSLEHFEVGPEVELAFRSVGLSEFIHPRNGARAHIDLRGAARYQLERAGARSVEVTGLCTWEQNDEFFSYRREVTHGTAATVGRMAAVIGVSRAGSRPAG